MKTNIKKPDGVANLLQMLTKYKAWANDITFKGVMALAPEEIIKVRKTNFKTILSTLNHVYVVDDIFKAHLQGTKHPYTARNTETSPPLDELWQKTKVMDQWYMELAEKLSPEEWDEIITFEFVGGGDGAMSRAEIILHLVNHGTYHRGFVSDMMYQIPVGPTANDLTVFLRERALSGD